MFYTAALWEGLSGMLYYDIPPLPESSIIITYLSFLLCTGFLILCHLATDEFFNIIYEIAALKLLVFPCLSVSSNTRAVKYDWQYSRKHDLFMFSNLSWTCIVAQQHFINSYRIFQSSAILCLTKYFPSILLWFGNTEKTFLNLKLSAYLFSNISFLPPEREREAEREKERERSRERIFFFPIKICINLSQSKGISSKSLVYQLCSAS